MFLIGLKKNSGKGSREFDVVILDPPSFTRNRASVPDALRGYKEIHLRALRMLPPGGLLGHLLLLASCG